MVKKFRSLALVVLATEVVFATVATPAKASQAAAESRIDVIATGLDNPRGLIIDSDRTVLVAEAGRGGGPELCRPGGQNLTWCLGATGAVTKIRRGHQQRIVTGLPSIIAPATGETAGPQDLVLTKSGALVTIGIGADPALRGPFGSGGQLLGQIVRLSRGGPRAFADLARYEQLNDPDQGQPGTGPDSNPYGLARGPHGGVVVTDAGGNDVLLVDQRGRISTLAVFPTVSTPVPGGTDTVPMQFVPTTVVRGPDGAYYVGQLTGFPFPPGGAKVWRLAPGEPPSIYKDGLTNIIDIAFDNRGRLIVLEISKNGLLSNDPTGALIRVESDGSRTEIASTGLVMPTSVAIDRDGCFYVSNRGTQIGVGEVLRIRPSK